MGLPQSAHPQGFVQFYDYIFFALIPLVNDNNLFRADDAEKQSAEVGMKIEI